MLDAVLDLLAGSGCVCCARPGRALCAACAAALPREPFRCWPTPTPDGLVPPTAVAEYADGVRAVVVAHKEHGRLALARPLGGLLAGAALAAWEEAGPTGRRAPLALVPVPSHPAVVRTRGHDPLLRTARVAASRLRGVGVAATVAPLLRVVDRPRDQAGLDAADRAANVHGRFAVRPRPGVPGALLLVDDVVTTGATLREAQRVLEEAGRLPFGAAVVAATRRRHSGSDRGR